MKKISFAVAAALAMCAAGSASAADGTINFTGRISASTCTIDYGATGSTIALGDISSGALDTNPDAGSRTFGFTLKASTSGGAAVCNKDNANLVIVPGLPLTSAGYLDNTHADGATIAVSLTRTDGTTPVLIDLGSPGRSLEQAKNTSGEFPYQFTARYHKTKTGTDFKEGLYTGRLMFDVDNY